MEKFDEVIVVDTNVLIHNPYMIYDYPGSLIVIPNIVIEELDGLKNSSDGNKRMMVRRASNLIKDVMIHNLDKKFMEFGEGSYLTVAFSHPIHLPSELPNKPDNLIISVALDYANIVERNEEINADRVVMLTNDINFQIIAMACAKEYNLPLKIEEYAVVDKSLFDIDSGVKEIESTAEKMAKARQDGYYIHNGDYINGDHIEIVEKGNPKHKILAQYDATQDRHVLLPDYKCGKPIWKVTGIDPVRPKDARQAFFAADILDTNKSLHFGLSKVAGAGKNFIATACALNLLEKGEYDRFIIIKPIVAVGGKELGYFPGSKEEKIKPWFDSFDDIMYELTGDGQGLTEDLEARIELDVMTQMRGRSIPRTIIQIDESQNIPEQDLKTILTRAGEDSKVILTGDLSQIDNVRLDPGTSGLRVWSDRARGNSYFKGSTYVFLEGNYRSELSKWASQFY